MFLGFNLSLFGPSAGTPLLCSAHLALVSLGERLRKAPLGRSRRGMYPGVVFLQGACPGGVQGFVRRTWGSRHGL